MPQRNQSEAALATEQNKKEARQEKLYARRKRLAEVLLHKMDHTVSVLAAMRAKPQLPSSLRTCGLEIEGQSREQRRINRRGHGVKR